MILGPAGEPLGKGEEGPGDVASLDDAVGVKQEDVTGLEGECLDAMVGLRQGAQAQRGAG
jgi:hypothetical protein